MSSITTHYPCHYSLDFDPVAAHCSLVERLNPTLATTSSTSRFPQYDMTRYEYFLQAQVPDWESHQLGSTQVERARRVWREEGR
jgi:hypothetical protein